MCKCNMSLNFITMDFSLLSPLEFFVDPKNVDGRNNKPPAMLEQCYEEGHVNVHNIVNEERAIMTADLIQECFEKRNTGIREAAYFQHLKETM